VIEDVAFVVRMVAAAVRGGFEGQDALHCPGDLVDAVARLFDQAVAGEPDEVIPVAHCHSTSPIPCGRVFAGGMGLTGPVRYVEYVARRSPIAPSWTRLKNSRRG